MHRKRPVRFEQMAILVKDRIENPSEAGVERYVGLEHLDSDSLKIHRWGEPSDVEAAKLLFRPGDIIFGKRRVYQRKLAVADFHGICSAHAMVLRARADVVLPEFLPFFMQSDGFMNRALEISVGSLSPTINWRTLAEQEFALPPLNEQRRIANILAALEQTIDSLNSLKHVAHSAWRSMSQLEFSRGNSSQISELGKFYKREKQQVTPKEVSNLDLPLVGPEHIAKTTGDIENHSFGSACDIESNKFYFHPGSVLYSRIRPNFQKAALVDFEGICSTEIYPLCPTEDIKGEYLLDLLLSQEFTRFVLSGTKGTGFPRVSHNHIAKFPVGIPSLPAQTEYLSIAIPLRRLGTAISGRLSHLGAVKAMILKKSFQR